MYINKIKLEGFRNYKKQEINLQKGINIFYGDNAQGKTNILEAIFICAIGKSFRTKKEIELINFQEEKANIEINYKRKDREGKIRVELYNNQKNFFSNGIKLKKISELLGKINIVMFSPENIDIIKGTPQNRRKFLDIAISQLKPAYLYNLNQYLKTLEQRNTYLRQIKYENKPIEMLEIWNEKISELSKKIYKERKEYIKKIKDKIYKIHKNVTNNNEEIEIKYISSFNNKYEFIEGLKKNIEIDLKRGYTSLRYTQR